MLKVAAVTQVKNEDVFLPLWRRYYGGHFGFSNLFVIDDGSTDGSTNGLASTQVLVRPQGPFDERERARAISALLEALLEFYDWVIYTDVDEFLILDPLLKMDFASYLDRVEWSHLNAVGINVLHNIFWEKQYDPKTPVFHQRSFGKLDRAYFKQLVHREPVIFEPGFHFSNHTRNISPGLYLVHLARFDKENTGRRWLVRNRIAWSEDAVRNGHSVQFRVPADKYVSDVYNVPVSGFMSSATPEQFSSYVMNFLGRVQREESQLDIYSNLSYQEELPILRFPSRFRSTIPAATAPLSESELSLQSILAFDGLFDPVVLYKRALEKSREESDVKC